MKEEIKIKYWEKEFDKLPQTEMTTKDFIRKLLIQEYKNGYNQCLRDLKLTKEEHQGLYL